MTHPLDNCCQLWRTVGSPSVEAGAGAETALNPQNPGQAWQGAAAGNVHELIIL